MINFNFKRKTMTFIITVKVENNFEIDGINFEGISINDEIKIGIEKKIDCCKNKNAVDFRFNGKFIDFKDLIIHCKIVENIYFDQSESEIEDGQVAFKITFMNSVLDIFFYNNCNNHLRKVVCKSDSCEEEFVI